MIKGSISALYTPFSQHNIDWDAFERLIEWQIASGTHALVICGTTGESPTLTHEEHRQLLKRGIEIVDGRIDVIAGTGSNSTHEAIDMTAFAKECGADAALIVTPYYNKPTQHGLFMHFKTIAEKVHIPIILYNIPGRSVIDISPQTMGELAKIPNIIGVKDATGDLSRVKKQIDSCGADFLQYSGDDATALEFLKLGGAGSISVASDIAPTLCARMHNAFINGSLEEAEEINAILAPLYAALFCESSPQPLKYAAAHFGLCENELRLPLVPASKEAQEQINALLHIVEEHENIEPYTKEGYAETKKIAQA